MAYDFHWYKRVSVKMFGDKKYLTLTPVKPSGQSLWQHLLLGPHNTKLPGLFKAGEARMAEEIGWSLRDFRKHFQEILDKEMIQVCTKNKLMFLPKSIYHDPPGSINVIKGWRKEWDLLPDCALKATAYEAFHDYLTNLNQAFLVTFVQFCEKPSSLPRPLAKAMPTPLPSGTPSPTPSPTPNPKDYKKGLSVNKPKHSSPELIEKANQVLEFLNRKANKNYPAFKKDGAPSVNLEFIMARMEEYEEVNVQVCKSIIAILIREWAHDPKMKRYLRPETIFNQSKFGGYFGELGKIPDESKTSD